MATIRYSTDVSLCEDTSKTFELYDLLKQADPNYLATSPIQVQLYVFDGSKYVPVTSGYFSAVDLDTLLLDMASLPNYNGDLKVRINGTDSSGSTFILDLNVTVNPVNDAPSGTDESFSIANGDVHVFALNDFGFADAIEGDSFKSVVITTPPTAGVLLLNGVAVVADQEILAADIAAGNLTYVAPTNSGGAIGFEFQVRDTGGTAGCGGADLDPTPNTIVFNVPQPNPAVIGDRVWEDANGNGVQDAGEAGIAGVVVLLKDSVGNIIGTTTTDASGNYSFSVAPGTYSVAIVTPSGYVVTGQDIGSNEASDSDINSAGQSGQVSVLAGQINNDLDAGLVKYAQLGDRVWLDSNSNGQQDAGETGVQGVKVTLLDASGDPVGSPLITDANGNYLFAGLLPGVYSVQFDKTTLPAGYSLTTANIGADASDSDADILTGQTAQVALASGESNLGLDAGIKAKSGSIVGSVREDVDNNDTGDIPIPGVTVTLVDANGNVVGTTTTDLNGNYIFIDVPTGTYTLVETNLPGYLDVGDADGGNPNSTSVTVIPRQSTTVGAFVDERPAIIGDKVWLDANANGVQDSGEAGIAGVTVQLKDSGGNVIGSTITDASGNYSFTVAPGTYSVTVVSPPGYVATAANQGTNDTVDSDFVNDDSGPVTVMGGTSNSTIDAGFIPVASLGDRVWLDSNANGQQDAGEIGVQGVKVTLLDASGNPVGSPLTTDANGNYLFTGLVPGVYSVLFDRITLPAGYSFTTANAGADASDSDADSATGLTAQVTLAAGESNLSLDAGIKANPGTIIGSVREDVDNNGTGDTPIPGVTITLLDPNGNVVGTTTTDQNGNYTFTDVPPGNYTLVETNPPGYLDVGDADGGNPNTTSVTVTPGQTTTVGAFVDERPATIGDKVWLDANANGVQDTGEAGIAGVTVQLKDSSGNVIASAITNASGNYSFSVAPGTYSVTVLSPGGYVATAANQGTNDTLDSDFVSGSSGPITAMGGSSNTTIDAGFYQRASLGDRIWLDSNGNGLQDSGEAGVAGVSVQLLNAAGSVVSTLTTGANGDYLFTNLVPGSYSIRVVAPSGYAFTTQNVGSNDATDSDVSTVGQSALTALTSGEIDRSWDAGLVAKLGAITGTVREDVDNNGSGDVGIAGVTVVLKNSSGITVATTSTDANGNYAFNGVPAGTYTVVEQNKAGYLDVSDIDGGNPNRIAVTLGLGQTSSGNNFVDERVASIGDRVWFDKNGNGLQDTGEAGAAGVTVKLLDAAGNLVATTTTNASGNYLFSNVAPGQYAVQVEAPTGYKFTTANVGTNDAIDSDFTWDGAGLSTGTTALITVNSGDAIRTVDAGVKLCLVSLGDKVWLDANGNGVQDAGEVGVAGVKVTLTGAGADGSFGTADDTAATTTTDANGNYLFSNVGWGSYKVGMVMPTGYQLTTANVGSNDALDSDFLVKTTSTTTSYETDTIVVNSCDDNLSIDAGLKLPVKASIGNLVWEDTNFNGIQDAGEAGIAGVTVKLLNSAGSVVSTTLTDATGKYLFSNLNAGDYSVQVVAPSGYYTTKQNQGTNDAVDSDIDSTGKTVLTTLSAGENDLSWDAGLYRKASLGDRVWQDYNYNWTQDAGEPGIANIKVWLWNDTTQSWSSTYTDAYGNYKFVNLDPGMYQLCFDKSATIYRGEDMSYWNWGTKDVGSNDNIDADAYSTSDLAYTDWISLSSGEVDLSWDATLTPIVIDLNGDGINTISRESSTGSFDLLGTGKAISSGWISSADAFLAIDSNGNGSVDNISELFGGYSKGDGFAKLASFDSNGDGVVNANDADFGKLLVWQDLNGNHQSDAGELRGLVEAGIESLKVDFVELPAVDASGNLHLERSSATLAGGKQVDMSDIYLNVSVDDANAAGIELPSLSALLGDDRSLDAILGGAAPTGVAPAPTAIPEGSVASLTQLASLYEQQQHELLAA